MVHKHSFVSWNSEALWYCVSKRTVTEVETAQARRKETHCVCRSALPCLLKTDAAQEKLSVTEFSYFVLAPRTIHWIFVSSVGMSAVSDDGKGYSKTRPDVLPRLAGSIRYAVSLCMSLGRIQQLKWQHGDLRQSSSEGKWKTRLLVLLTPSGAPANAGGSVAVDSLIHFHGAVLALNGTARNAPALLSMCVDMRCHGIARHSRDSSLA